MQILLLFLLCISFHVFGEPLNVSVVADAALLVNAETGAILYEKKANELYYPASLTKIATAAYALKMAGDKMDVMIAAEQDSIASISDEAKRRSNYTLPSHWLETGASHIGIKKGEELSLRDLMYGMMIASGDDASNVIASYVGGSIPKFMDQLNAYVKELGCQNTHFTNPHGLHHPKLQTTAKDLFILTREAMKDPTFCQIVATRRYTRPKTNKQASTILVQTNRLLTNGKLHYSHAIGVKTGFHSFAQHNLVAAARQNDRTLIAVLLKTKERSDMFKDAAKLFEAAFNQQQVERVLLKAGPQKFTLELEDAAEPISTFLQDDIKLSYYPAEEPNVKCLLVWDEVKPPIAKNQKVGELRIVLDEERLYKSVPLLAEQDVNANWSTRILRFFQRT